MFPACKHRMALARISPGERGFLLAQHRARMRVRRGDNHGNNIAQKARTRLRGAGVIGHALQEFSGIQLSVPAFMMSPEWSVNKAGALDGEAAHEKHRGRRGRNHRENNG